MSSIPYKNDGILSSIVEKVYVSRTTDFVVLVAVDVVVDNIAQTQPRELTFQIIPEFVQNKSIVVFRVPVHQVLGLLFDVGPNPNPFVSWINKFLLGG